MRVLPEGGEPVELERIHPAGVFEGEVAGRAAARLPARGRVSRTALHVELDDPYSFLPTLGELDLHLAARGPARAAVREARRARARGRRRRAARRSRSGRRTRARSASSATSTAGTAACTRCARSARPASGSCSCRASRTARATSSSCRDAGRHVHLQADPFALATEHAAADRLGRLRRCAHVWQDDEWLERRAARRPAGASRSRSTRCTSARGGQGLDLPRARPSSSPTYVPRPRLHARRAAAGHGAPVRRLVGLPGDGVLRADVALRHARRLPRASSTRCTSRASA